MVADTGVDQDRAPPELTMKSPEFVAMWADHQITPCEAASYDLHHPVIGAVTVTQQTLAIARSPEQNLIVVTTAAGSPSEEALALLRQAGRHADSTGVEPGIRSPFSPVDSVVLQ